jgi:hypothetical protein
MSPVCHLTADKRDRDEPHRRIVHPRLKFTTRDVAAGTPTRPGLLRHDLTGDEPSNRCPIALSTLSGLYGPPHRREKDRKSVDGVTGEVALTDASPRSARGGLVAA